MIKLKRVSYRDISSGTHLSTGVCTLTPWFLTAMCLINMRESVGVTILGVCLLSLRFIFTFLYFHPVCKHDALSEVDCFRSLLRLTSGVLIDGGLCILGGIALAFSILPVYLVYISIISGVLAFIFQFLGVSALVIKSGNTSEVIDISRKDDIDNILEVKDENRGVL